MSHLPCYVIDAFILVLFVRALLSWFPLQPGGLAAQIGSIAFGLTEWALAPLRRMIPPTGMFDLSFLVLVFGLLLLQSVVC